MVDFASTLTSVEKLRFKQLQIMEHENAILFLSQELWDIAGGSDTTPPTNVKAAKRWKVTAGKAMYALTVVVKDEFHTQRSLEHTCDNFYKEE